MKWYNVDIIAGIKKKLNSWTDWVTNVWNSVFPASVSSSTGTSNTVNRSRGSSVSRDLTFPTTVNYDLCMNLYYNSKAGYKLGGHLCFNPISVPLCFQGIPHFNVDDWDMISNTEFWEKKFKFYNEKYIINKQNIQKLCHITGTVAIWPWFDSKAGHVKWEFILSKYITDILLDIKTKQYAGIVTTIEYQFNDETGKIRYFEEKKKYTISKIIINRTGNLPEGLRSQEIYRNPIQRLPIFFLNDFEPGEFEGHSDLERIIPLIMAYSDINKRIHEEGMNHRAKLLQEIEDRNTWMANNGFTDLADINIDDIDFILNKAGIEKTEIIVPQRLVDNLMLILKNDFHGIVEGSGIPEICWGLKTEGNHASAAEQMGVLLSFVGKKQIQETNPYYELWESTLFLEAMAYNQKIPENLTISWDNLDSLTEVERSEIFKNWADGITKLIENHAIDLEGVHTLLIELTKNKITDKFEDFKKQIKEYGTIISMLEQEYGGMRDFITDGTGDENNQDDEMNIDNVIPDNGNGKGNKSFILSGK